MAKDLSENAVIVRCSIGQWSGRKKDKALANEIAEQKGAKKAPSVFKPLAIDNELEAISKAVTEARTFHYEHTLPWLYNGAAIISIEEFEAYCQKMQGFKTKIREKVDELIEHYDELIDKAEQAQNGMFKRSDYPSKTKLESLFHFDLEFDPVPQDHFVSRVMSNALKEAEKEHQGRIRDAKALVLKEAFMRLHEVINHAYQSLAGNKKFHDTLVGNIVELVGILPGLNILGDPMLNDLTQEAKANLTIFTADELRMDKALRQSVADKAKDILDKMSGYIGTPEPVEPPKPEPLPEVPVSDHEPFTTRKRGGSRVDDIISIIEGGV